MSAATVQMYPSTKTGTLFSDASKMLPTSAHSSAPPKRARSAVGPPVRTPPLCEDRAFRTMPTFLAMAFFEISLPTVAPTPQASLGSQPVKAQRSREEIVVLPIPISPKRIKSCCCANASLTLVLPTSISLNTSPLVMAWPLQQFRVPSLNLNETSAFASLGGSPRPSLTPTSTTFRSTLFALAKTGAAVSPVLRPFKMLLVTSWGKPEHPSPPLASLFATPWSAQKMMSTGERMEGVGDFCKAANRAHQSSRVPNEPTGLHLRSSSSVIASYMSAKSPSNARASPPFAETLVPPLFFEVSSLWNTSGGPTAAHQRHKNRLARASLYTAPSLSMMSQRPRSPVTRSLRSQRPSKTFMAIPSRLALARIVVNATSSATHIVAPR
mmetsp:Transcript_12963/g.36346  ORF Transcript_12963/g.36346 Transcript_12963/m.36346 type:complete len:383 (-) Transcript_12963:908-2056(-)